MAKIGNLGNLISFQTSDSRVLNFTDFKEEISGRWSTHDRIMQKPLLEFNGPSLREITFTVVLDAMLGVKPRKTLEKIQKSVEKGYKYSLVIGGKKVGKNKWCITGISNTWDVVYSKGDLARVTLSMTLQEYL